MHTSRSHSPVSIAVLASGEGTNFQAILDAIHTKTLAAEVHLLFSNNPTAQALERARKVHIPTRVVAQPSAEILLQILQEASVELVCLAGYMKLLPAAVVQAYPNRIINIHPALLPAFPGLHAIRQALAAGVQTTGVTVHFVDTGIDTGPVILQETVVITPDDTEQSLAAKIHLVEHRLYPRALQLFAEKRLHVVGQKVLIQSDEP